MSKDKELKAGSTFKPEFMVNMDYVAGLVAGVSQRTVVYDDPRRRHYCLICGMSERSRA